MACTPQQIKHTRQNWQAPNFTPMDRARIHFSYYVNFGACQSWRPCSIHILTTPFFLAQSAPSGIFLCSLRDGRDDLQDTKKNTKITESIRGGLHASKQQTVFFWTS
jgi:hypothetical protein